MPPSRLVPNASMTSHTRPVRISSRPQRISNASIQISLSFIIFIDFYRTGLSRRGSSFIDLEVGARRGYGFGFGGLPGIDGDVGDTSALSPDLALGVGVTIMACAQVIYREVDDFRQMWQPHEHQQVQRGRMLHKPGQHSAVNGRQGRIAQGVPAGGQAEHHFVAQAQALDTDQLGVGNQADQPVIVIALVGILHPVLEVQRAHSSAPWRAGTDALTLPIRIKAPTTWAMGCSGSSW